MHGVWKKKKITIKKSDSRLKRNTLKLETFQSLNERNPMEAF
jgi:hypothetical protein